MASQQDYEDDVDAKENQNIELYKEKVEKFTSVLKPMIDREAVDKKEYLTVVDTFNEIILAIMKFLDEHKTNKSSEDIRMLASILDDLKSLTPELMIERCQPKIWDAADKIKNHDADYFLKRDYSKLIKNDERTKMIYGIVNAIKTGWNSLYPYEKNYIWSMSELLLDCVLLRIIHKG